MSATASDCGSVNVGELISVAKQFCSRRFLLQATRARAASGEVQTGGDKQRNAELLRLPKVPKPDISGQWARAALPGWQGHVVKAPGAGCGGAISALLGVNGRPAGCWLALGGGADFGACVGSSSAAAARRAGWCGGEAFLLPASMRRRGKGKRKWQLWPPGRRRRGSVRAALQEDETVTTRYADIDSSTYSLVISSDVFARCLLLAHTAAASPTRPLASARQWSTLSLARQQRADFLRVQRRLGRRRRLSCCVGQVLRRSPHRRLTSDS